jgi:hypothetical protein
MGFNSGFKGLKLNASTLPTCDITQSGKLQQVADIQRTALKFPISVSTTYTSRSGFLDYVLCYLCHHTNLYEGL